jgi:RNA polymerase sigma-70 factor, ECF subfamily
MLGNREAAEDAAQEAFLRLAQHDNPSLDTEAARRWLFVVARNLCINQLRRATRHGEEPLDWHADMPDTGANPAELGAKQDRGERVREAVAALPPAMREIVVLREYESMAYAEIAAVLGCGEGTVKSRLARARDLLRVRLKPFVEAER